MKEKELVLDDSQCYRDFLSKSERKELEQLAKPINTENANK